MCTRPTITNWPLIRDFQPCMLTLYTKQLPSEFGGGQHEDNVIEKHKHQTYQDNRLQQIDNKFWQAPGKLVKESL